MRSNCPPLLKITIQISLLLLQWFAFYNDALGNDENFADAPEYATDEDFDQESEVDERLSELREGSATTVRRFHEVLDELLAEFSYDVKSGQLRGLKNLAIRKVSVSDAIPNTYQSYTKLLVSERIRENSRVRMINCMPCSSRTSRLIKGKIVITSPTTNLGELRTASDNLGIDNFMDIILVYHSTHMVLAMQIFKPDTHEMIWTRTYNSETIKSRYQKLAVDYSQVAKSRPGEDYEPEYRVLLGFGGAGIPNIAGTNRDSSMVNLQVRSTEKFDNRRSEFGMTANIYLTLSSILTEYPTAEGSTEGNEQWAQDEASEQDFETSVQPEPFTAAIGLYGIYARNFVGSIESYDEIRHGLHFALGTLLTVGYLGPTVKIGWDVYFGRRFALGFTANYIAPSQVLIQGNPIATNGGAGGEVVLSFNY